jgi:hypothetical protein
LQASRPIIQVAREIRLVIPAKPLAAGGFDESKAMHYFIIVTPAPCGVLPLCACALVVLTSPFDPHSSSRLLLTNTAMRQPTKAQSHRFIYAHPSVHLLSGLLSCLIAIRLRALARCALCSSLLGVVMSPSMNAHECARRIKRLLWA